MRGYPTTWGATPYRDQVIDADATVVAAAGRGGRGAGRQADAGRAGLGRCLVRRHDPQPLEPGGRLERVVGGVGGGGGGAGWSASPSAPRRYGSIVSPGHALRRHRAAPHLRPRQPRTAAMALSWSMDKIGPLARSVEDCALVFAAIYGPGRAGPHGGRRPVRLARPACDLRRPAHRLCGRPPLPRSGTTRRNDDAALDVLRELGADLIPISLPDYPIDALSIILDAEAAAAFDELTRSDRDDLLERQGAGRLAQRRSASARLIPAVEYIQANRVRTLIMQAMAELHGAGGCLRRAQLWRRQPAADQPDRPPGGGRAQRLHRRGHARPASPSPGGSTTRPRVLAVAHAYQEATDFHRQHPPGFLAGAPLPAIPVPDT